MKKKILLLVFAFVLLFSISEKTFAEGENVKLFINGEYVETDVEPFIENGRTLVPIRVISENLGYDVAWDGDLKTVTISSFSDRYNKYEGLFVLNIDSPVLVSFDLEKINKLFGKGPVDIREIKSVMDESKKSEILDVAPKVIDNRTFVPVRVIAESMGEKVTWDHENWTVIIGENK